MRALTDERDWMRQQADDATQPPAARELWAMLADEIDLFLASDDTDVDLFGDVSEMPVPDVHRWEDA